MKKNHRRRGGFFLYISEDKDYKQFDWPEVKQTKKSSKADIDITKFEKQKSVRNLRN